MYVRPWRTGKSKKSDGSVVVVIPKAFAETLKITEMTMLRCFIDLDRKELRYKKA